MKHLGLLSILLGWIGFAILLYKGRGNSSISLSKHAVLTKASYFFFIIIFAITIPLFYLFTIKWLAPTLNLPKLFIDLISIGLIFQILYVLIPDLKGICGILHKFFAYSFAFLLIPLNIIIFTSNSLSPIGRFVSFASTLFMVFGLFFLLWKKGKLGYYLFFQIAYVLCFHASILIATYF